MAGYESALLRFDLIIRDKSYVMLMLLSLCSVAAIGLLRWPLSRAGKTLWAAGVLDFLFAISYGVSDRFTFFLPGAAVLSILGVLAIQSRLGSSRSTQVTTFMLAVLHPAVLMTTVALAATGVVRLPTSSVSLPFRDDVRYFVAPYIPDRSAERFVSAYESIVPEGAAVIADYSPLGALFASRVTGRLSGRQFIQCDEERQSWPDVAFLVRKDYCDMVTQHYHVRPATLGWILSQ